MKIGIIGAGASGMTAAVAAADHGAEVTVFEKNDRIGKKILVTGNGKCNIGNLAFNMEQYYCDDKEKLKNIFSMFSPWDTVSFFESSGMMVRNKNGYLYPYSEQASTVLDIFRKLLRQRRVNLVTETEITDAFYDKKTEKFAVEGNGKRFWADRLILSAGGPASQKRNEGWSGFELARRFGHSLRRPVPGLVQLRTGEPYIKLMAGVRTAARAELFVDGIFCSAQQGEVQFTEYGISGIPVFQFSRIASYALEEKKAVFVKINLFPDYEPKSFEYTVRNRFESMREASVEEFLLGMANKKINAALIKKEGFKPSCRVDEIGFAGIKKLTDNFRELNLPISSSNGMENAQICAGGVDFSEVDMHLESAKQPGLYLTGELLDVDGKCGGYNLQWAWTSGYLAGRNAAKGAGKEEKRSGKRRQNAAD